MPSDSNEMKVLIDLLARLPGLGPVSARRIVLHLIRSKGRKLTEIASAMQRVAENVCECRECGNLSTGETCPICASVNRSDSQICVVEDIADLWAMERTAAYKGKYHVLGGVLSVVDGLGPEELKIPALVARVEDVRATEVILALGATLEGKMTADYIADQLSGTDAKVTRLAVGVPVGGELDFLDDGTIAVALSRRW